jgi:hypothetical protein
LSTAVLTVLTVFGWLVLVPGPGHAP